MPRRSVEELDDWANAHELRHAREKIESKADDATVLEAVKRHVDGALKPLADLPGVVAVAVSKLDSVAATNETQLTMMRETERYRGHREEQERAAKQKKSEEDSALEKAKTEAAIALDNAKLELERQKVEAAAKAAADAKALEELKQKNDRLKAWLGAAAAVLVALIGAYFAVRK